MVDDEDRENEGDLVFAADGSGDRAAGAHGSRFVRGPVPPLWRIDKLWDVGAVGIYASLTSLGRIR